MVSPDLSVTTLQKAVGLLDSTQAELKKQVLQQCDRITNPTLRITVFGPFNYGKSTLLNALLGDKTLPIDLVPTTGAAITVNYGSELSSRITLTNGQVLEAPGTDLLKQYATLDEQRCMRQDVTAVDVKCPHPFLQPGVELVDLPGTDDREAQNELVYNKLLETDVVIQLLDGRKLMTLAEREHLQDWLLERGITTVVFVVNFLNLMEPDERKQVMYRLRFLAQDFRATLPHGVSNLYAVDALPALRARLKGDMAAATQAGLPALESALHTLLQVRWPELTHDRLLRLLPLTVQLQQTLQQQLNTLETASQPDIRRVEIQTRAQQLIQKGFHQSANELRDWLSLRNLLQHYQESFAIALQSGTAPQWLEETLQPVWKQKKRTVTEWVYKACDFFEQPRPVDLWVGWILTDPMGAAVLGGTSHCINRADRKKKTPQKTPQPEIPSTVSNDAARDYLAHFSETALNALADYQERTRPVLNKSIGKPLTQSQQVGQRTLIENILVELEHLQQELGN